MPRTNFVPALVLVVLIAPVIHLLSLKNAPSADPGYGLIYYSIMLSGPSLLVYGFVTYQYKQHRTLAWIAFMLGGGVAGYVYIWGTLMLFLGKA